MEITFPLWLFKLWCASWFSPQNHPACGAWASPVMYRAFAIAALPLTLVCMNWMLPYWEAGGPDEVPGRAVVMTLLAAVTAMLWPACSILVPAFTGASAMNRHAKQKLERRKLRARQDEERQREIDAVDKELGL